MSDAPSDKNRDFETNARLRRIAGDIFAHYGIDFATAKRAGGWSNATWLAGGLALRLSVRPGNETIRREARLAALLPPETGYPTILETGETEGYEWSLSKEIPGRNLGEVWPELDWDGRISALRQLWSKAQAVHTVNVAAAAGLARQRAWFNSSSAEEAGASLVRLAQQGIISPRQIDVLRETLDCFWKALPSAACVLNHGDLTIDNALYHEGQVVALIDFEFAVIAPAELDLNALVKYAYGPPETGDPFPDPDNSGRKRIRQEVAGLAKPVLAHPGGKDLLSGYAILLEVWMLADWLAHPEGEGPLEQWQPYRRLISLADGQGGYLKDLF